MVIYSIMTIKPSFFIKIYKCFANNFIDSQKKVKQGVFL